MWLKVLASVAVEPRLWPTALRQLFRLAPNRWWAKAPFLPLPPADYLEFRLVTQYGGGEGAPRPDIEPNDVVEYLRWCRRWDRRS